MRSWKVVEHQLDFASVSTLRSSSRFSCLSFCRKRRFFTSASSSAFAPCVLETIISDSPEPESSSSRISPR